MDFPFQRNNGLWRMLQENVRKKLLSIDVQKTNLAAALIGRWFNQLGYCKKGASGSIKYRAS